MTTMDLHRAAAYVDLGVLEENVNLIRSRVPAGVKLLCVVKADAYGHGAVVVSARLEACGVDYLGVANIDEGIELRESGIKLPILIMGGLFPWDDPARALEYGLTLIVYDADILKRIVAESPSFAAPLKVHVKVDTGMGRLGFSVDDMSFVARQLRSSRNIVCEGLMTHFSASEVHDEYGVGQVRLFRKAFEALVANDVKPAIVHMANSGAITQYPEAHFDMVRAGITLYGSHPSPELEKVIPVKQVMRLVSSVALIREFPPGSSLSYGRTYITGGTTKVAYIPVGYADGYPRSLSSKGFVLIKERKCSIVGIVCMDWMLVDITGVEGVRVGDEVILLGYGATEAITADELAVHAGTIPYEILCRVSKRVQRVYV